ncbi:lysophospholipid acyltransferase family protein [Ekhidna sp.]|uniref:lysophospholipid acyltransferase family protein n=1 Tax=Ekhidna sp. TaxID=2608089 RepID=UPI0035165562
MSTEKETQLKLFVNKAYLIYTGIIFFLLFFILFPFFFLLVILGQKKYGLVLTRHWTTVFFFLLGMKIDIKNNHLLDKKSTYIFCPNHFSFLDIPLMAQMPIAVQFVGKESLSKIPAFGYYFRKFHITVDRDSLRSKYKAFKESVDSLKKGFSLTVFPEGGINVANTKNLSEFKEGPFKMALETGFQLVPITIADNWRILPDDEKYLMRWKWKNRIIIHEPIDPSKYSIETLNEFQSEVKNIIQAELDKTNRLDCKIKKPTEVGYNVESEGFEPSN